MDYSTTNFPPAAHEGAPQAFSSRSGGAGWGPVRASARSRRASARDAGASGSAGTGTFVGKLAIGLEAAFVDAFQAFGDHCLQFTALALLLGVFRIHQCAAVT